MPERLSTAMKFSIILAIVQIAFIVLYAVLVDYGYHAKPRKLESGGNSSSSKFHRPPAQNDITVYYPSKYNPPKSAKGRCKKN